MGDLHKWHSDEEVYKREALGTVDKADEREETKSLPGMLVLWSSGGELSLMSWAHFKNFYTKCHNTLANVSEESSCTSYIH
jgi:hypothetical protein